MVTTYQPDETLLTVVARVLCQAGLVVIVDDSAAQETRGLLQSWFGAVQRVVVHHNRVNSGIASSLNEGVGIARRRGYVWILTLDDDSIVDPDMLRRLIEYLHCVCGPVALIGMSWRHRGSAGLAQRRHPRRHQWAEKRGIITSGSLFSLQTYDRLGPFRDEFVIDFVDYDYCLRARAQGYHVIKLDEVGFEHSLGCRTVHRILWGAVETFNHDPLRLYYICRNSITLALEHIKRDPLYACAVVKGQVELLVRVVVFESAKLKKLRYMLRGLRDGFAHRLGKLEAREDAR